MASPKKSAEPHPGGRPMKYTPEWLQEEALALRAWIIKPRSLWLKGFAHERGYSASRYTEFAQASTEFSLALEFAKNEQERKFIDGAWSKEMDMAFVRYFMPRLLKDRPEWKNSFDMPDSQTVEHIGTVTVNRITKPAK